MWLVILFMARPYALFIISIANRRDRMGLLETFHGDPAIGFLGAIAAIPALIVVLAWIKRAPGAAPLTRWIWAKGGYLLILAGVLNMTIIILPALTSPTWHINTVVPAEAILCGMIIVYLIRSTRIRDTFADFPETSASE
jgi:hypothetical protein